MVDNFTKIIEKAKKEGTEKLKVIAPKYTPPSIKKPSRVSGGGGGGGRSRRQPMSRIETPTKSASEILAGKRATEDIIQKERQRQANIEFRQKLQQAQTKAREMKAPGFRIGLSSEERKLPKREIIKRRFREVGTGVVAGTGAVIEGTVGLAGMFGTQKIEFDEEGKRIKKDFKFKEDSFFGKAMAQPSGTGKVLGQTLVFAPAAGAGIRGVAGRIRTVGLRRTAIETTTSLSPFRIPTQTFGALQTKALAKDLRFNVASIRQRKGDITRRFISGKAMGQEARIISKQITRTLPSQKQAGLAETDIIAPTITFREGKFIPGIQAIKTKSVMAGIPGKPTRIIKEDKTIIKEPLKGVMGSASGVISRETVAVGITREGLSAAITPKAPLKPRLTAGITRRTKEGYDLFVGGGARRGAVISKEGIRRVARLKDPDIRGAEIDISKMFRGEKIIGDKPSKGLTQASKQLSEAVSQATKGFPTKPTTQPSIKTIQLISAKPSNLIPKISQKQIEAPQKIIFKPETKQAKPQLEKPLVKSFSKVSPRIKPKLKIKPAQDVEVKQKIQQKQRPLQKTKTKQLFKIPTTQKTISYPSQFRPPRAFRQVRTPTLFKMPKFFKRKIELIFTRKKVSKTFQKTKYTPSLTGTIFKIKAKKAPRKILGGYGIGTRPIIIKSSIKRK